MTRKEPSGAPRVLRYAAFTSDPAGGNPAGVVLDASGLDAGRMREIAAEVGYSETAFVTAGDADSRRFRVRYFSPLAEVDFCGHATIATAVALAEQLGAGELTFDTNAGEIPVATAVGDDGVVRATLTSVPTWSRPAEDAEVDAALRELRWTREELDPTLPAHVAFGGVTHLVLAAATRERLAQLDYDFDGLAEVMRQYGWTTVHLVWREKPDLFHARNPFPVGGVIEDPATGAAAAAFGGYLRTIAQTPETGQATILQGTDISHPSLLTITTHITNPRVQVTGQSTPLPET
ncbi:PhzF family phenazine biosynthesis isomerase [Streptomyces sp. NPDC087212]|uniref:PhzF family phenazine biosynthesis isomerase n=1 Tax=Streptomyces sp. NPDC087212 TaxID=3365766 RepID=UPI0037F2F8DE